MDEETLKSDASEHDLSSDGVLLTAVREEYQSRFGRPPGARFPEDVLIVYTAESLEERLSVKEVAERVVDRCADRIGKAADKKPHQDDPVGVKEHKDAAQAARVARKSQQDAAAARLLDQKNEAQRERERKHREARIARDQKAIAELDRIDGGGQ